MLKPKELGDELPGFEAHIEVEGEKNETQSSKKKKKSSGGFQAMGFGFSVMKGITKRGYKLPTPIQRKSIPVALEGKDLVAMARTGSGKTACFVLPILEKLTAPMNKTTTGKHIGAIILSPTRELALQTLRFVRELGKFTGLTSAAILGGESIEQQFSVMSGTAPDIIVATPGRFLHICVEMNLKLDKIKIIVFDEADRLFELGFGDQLREIVARLPPNRQSLLFSATLPKMLVEFARAGLSDPVLIRLDVDWKLPSTLWLGWIYVRSELKTAALLVLLEKVLTPTTPQAVVFAATKHHVEYLHLILQKAGITSSYAYSGLDSSARKIALGRFSNNKCSVLIVTDVAARGLDLPALDTVINYNFPGTPKLFVHRVGRSARAGRAGKAFSLIAAEDLAHLLDLQLFLGTELVGPGGDGGAGGDGGQCPSGTWGAIPGAACELMHRTVLDWEKGDALIEDAARVQARGWQQYIKWREPASAEANKRAKTITVPVLTHPFFVDSTQEAANELVAKIKNYTPKGTILELTAKNDSPMYIAMKEKKQKHGKTIQKTRDSKLLQPADENIQHGLSKRKKKEVVRDENYIPHFASDQHTETGMSVNFNSGAASAELEMGADSGEGERARRSMLRWDRRRKKMVQVEPEGGRKMIRTESGGRIPATYRSGRYDEWRKKNAHLDAESDEDDAARNQNRKRPISEFRPHWAKHNERLASKKAMAPSNEFKNKQQIVKERLRKEKIKMRLKHKMKGKKGGKKRK